MDVFLYILFVLLGIGLGIATGIIPGFHVNNVAIITLSIYYSTHASPILLANMIVANMITHTFVDFIPSTFLGAPSEDTSISVLPMHRMVLRGEGFKAIYISSYASLLAAIFALPFIPLLQILLVHFKLSQALWYYTPVILVAIILGMFYLESRKGLRYLGFSILVFALAGLFGYLALNFPLNYNYTLPGITPNILFPLFTGLFGIPVLLLSQKTKIPPQKIEKPKITRKNYLSSLGGTLAGALVGFLPGVTSGVAAVISRLFIKSEETEDFIFALGSVNTANYIFNLAALFLILRPRSGAVNAISQMINVKSWEYLQLVPNLFLLILLTVAIASLLSFFITIYLGKVFAGAVWKLRRHYGQISRIIIIALFLLIFIFSGTMGVIFAIVATLIGLLPPKMGIMRVHLMAVIILPVLLGYI